MERTISITALQQTGVESWAVKDDSPRGIHFAYISEIKPGDRVVIDNYFTTITEAEEAAESPTRAKRKAPCTNADQSRVQRA